MKKNIFHLTTLMLLLTATAIRAEVVSVDEARATAQKFVVSAQLSQHMRGMTISSEDNLSAPIALAKDGETALYVFNLKSGGYVIVSAEGDTQRKVLAWSDKGSYDPANVPAPMKDVLDSYIGGINRLRRASTAERVLIEKAIDNASKTSPRRGISSLPASVDPLLGDIEWNQDEPYNLMTPTYAQNGNTYHYVTGCVATAVAQVMMYHRWPEQGHGSNSYEWKGQTLSADFSQSIYRWDLMLPSYRITSWYPMETNYTDEQANAVALLMHDVGYALSMHYEKDGSGSSVQPSVLINNFDYDRDIKTLSSNYCSPEDWENELRKELAEARPVLCGGGSNIGAHEFVCDGYDTEGLFHYNFGWGGKSNGWYASSATGFDMSPTIVYA